MNGNNEAQSGEVECKEGRETSKARESKGGQGENESRQCQLTEMRGKMGRGRGMHGAERNEGGRDEGREGQLGDGMKGSKSR